MKSVTVTGSELSASYGYLANSDALGTTTVTQDGAARLTATRVLDGLGRLRSLTQVNGLGATVASDTYDYDERHRRTKSTRNAGESWNYGYNTRNEVTSAGKKDSADASLPGYSSTYLYDAIANRTTTVINGEPAEWQANSLNQYSSRDVPGVVDVVGGRIDLGGMSGGGNDGRSDSSDEIVHIPPVLRIDCRSFPPRGGCRASHSSDAR